MPPLLPLLSALFGCAGSQPCEDCTAADVEDSGVPPFSYADPTPDLTADDVGSAIFEAFAHGFPNGTTLRDTYLTMMSQGDATCPASDTIITQDFVLGCTADSGYYYSGVCVYDTETFDDEVGTTTTWGLGGDFVLAYPDGKKFAAGGGATYTGQRTTEGDEIFDTTVRGTWYDESATTWLGQGLSSLYSAKGGKTGGKPYLTIYGGIGIGDYDLFLDMMNWDWGGACDGSPTGSLRLRDTRGYWYVWTLDDDCDTCGEVVFHGDTDLGQLCIDLKPVGEDAYYGMAVPP